MAAINHTTVQMSRGSHYWEWLAISESDTPDNLDDGDGAVAFADKTVQVDGTFGTGTVTIEGSNDGVSFFGLKDPNGTAISFTAAGMAAILENPRYIKPVITGATGASINVRITGRAVIQLF